jgi:hypothetical protein
MGTASLGRAVGDVSGWVHSGGTSILETTS